MNRNLALILKYEVDILLIKELNILLLPKEFTGFALAVGGLPYLHAKTYVKYYKKHNYLNDLSTR